MATNGINYFYNVFVLNAMTEIKYDKIFIDIGIKWYKTFFPSFFSNSTLIILPNKIFLLTSF